MASNFKSVAEGIEQKNSFPNSSFRRAPSGGQLSSWSRHLGKTSSVFRKPQQSPRIYAVIWNLILASAFTASNEVLEDRMIKFCKQCLHAVQLTNSSSTNSGQCLQIYYACMLSRGHNNCERTRRILSSVEYLVFDAFGTSASNKQIRSSWLLITFALMVIDVYLIGNFWTCANLLSEIYEQIMT